MNVRLYANGSTLALTERLEGGSFQPPAIPAYQDLHVRFKLAESINSVPTIDKRPLHSLVAKIGWPDQAPVSGEYRLEITLGGDTVMTGDIAYNATATQIAAAINTALGTEIATLNPCTVSEYKGLHRIVFADKTLRPTFDRAENALWPASFIEVDEIEFDEGYAYVLQLRQAPVAEVATFSEQVPSIPAITERQAGGEVDGFAYNAIQKLTLSPAFEGGAFRIVRSGKKTVPITVPTNVETIRSAVAPLADTGSLFLVTETSNGAYLEFTGSMGGTAQDLMTIEVFESPGVDYFFHLPTKTDDMRTLMRNVDTSGQVRIPLTLELEITDPLAPGGKQEVKIQQEMTFIRPVPSSANNVAASLRWGQPLSKGDYLKHSTGSLLVGNRGMKFTIGDGSTESFALPHNLVENPQVVTANATTNRLAGVDHNYQDLDPITFSTTGTLPAPLDPAKTYFVLAAAASDFQVSLTPNGAAVDLTNAGTGIHTARLKDGTIEHIAVEVWETGGNEERLPQSSYTVARTSLDVVTVSGFPTTPTAGQYDVVIQTYGRPATYQAHQHEIDETPEAKQRIEALEARVTALENGNFGGSAPALSTVTTGKIDRPLPKVWNILRSRSTDLPADPGPLNLWNPFGEGSTLKDIRLLPAVHLVAGSVEALPPTLPAPNSQYRGRVFYSAVDVPGLLSAGQYAACTGLEWYRVRRESSDETTWYPTAMEMEFFRLTVSPDELALRTRLDLAVGIELALFDPSRRPADRRTVGRMSLILERGVRVVDSTPSATGSNIATHFGSPVILAQHDFDLTEVVTQKRMSLSVARDGAGTLTALASKMMGAAVAVSAPASADFALRLRLGRVDFENIPTDGRGLLAVRGPDVGMDGQADQALGRYGIS